MTGILGCQMLPTMLVIIPIFLIFARTGLYESMQNRGELTLAALDIPVISHAGRQIMVCAVSAFRRDSPRFCMLSSQIVHVFGEPMHLRCCELVIDDRCVTSIAAAQIGEADAQPLRSKDTGGGIHEGYAADRPWWARYVAVWRCTGPNARPR
jgi:hypothetical protein